MRNLKIVIALLLLTVAFYSCDSTVTVDDPKSETIQEINMKTGDEQNETDGRGKN